MAVTITKSSGFGSTVVGTSSPSITVTLANTGTGSATVTVTGDLSHFEGVNSPYTVAGGATTTVTLTHKPTAVGTQSLTFTSGSVTMGVSGTGILETENLVTGVDVDQSGQLTAADVTRYRIHVPTEDTWLIMGKGSTSPSTPDGFGIRTDHKFFARAGQNVAMQSQKETVLQAFDGSLYALAKSDSVLAGKNSANVLAQGAVVIGGGMGTLTLNDMTGDRSENHVDHEDGAESFKNNRIAGAAVLSGMDAFLGLVTVAYAGTNLYSTATDLRTGFSKTKLGGGIVSGVGALVGLTGAFFSAWGAVASSSSPINGVTILGGSGVTVGSPGFSGFWSLAGLTLFSLYPALLGVEPFIFGMKSISLKGGSSTDIYATRKLHLHSGSPFKTGSAGGVRITAGTVLPATGHIAIEAGKVEIGKDGTSQRTTDILLTVGPVGTESQIEMKAVPGAVTAKATTKLELSAGPTTKLTADVATLKAEAPLSGKLELAGTKALVEGVTAATLQLAGGVNKVEAAAAGVTVLGALVNVEATGILTLKGSMVKIN